MKKGVYFRVTTRGTIRVLRYRGLKNYANNVLGHYAILISGNRIVFVFGRLLH